MGGMTGHKSVTTSSTAEEVVTLFCWLKRHRLKDASFQDRDQTQRELIASELNLRVLLCYDKF
jgi:hypothetical protein